MCGVCKFEAERGFYEEKNGNFKIGEFVWMIVNIYLKKWL